MVAPLIAISSPQAKAGKTTLTFNLVSALLHDGYKVGVYSDFTSEFLEKRAELKKRETNLKMPRNICREALFAGDFADSDALIVDVPSLQDADFLPLFAKAHTLITLLNHENDLSWQPSDPYLNIIWSVKKQQAANGVKCLNWVITENQLAPKTNNLSQILEQQCRRFGFRKSPALQARETYTHIKNGYGVADLVNTDRLKMSMSDVYARRELLILAAYIWQHK